MEVLTVKRTPPLTCAGKKTVSLIFYLLLQAHRLYLTNFGNFVKLLIASRMEEGQLELFDADGDNGDDEGNFSEEGEGNINNPDSNGGEKKSTPGATDEGASNQENEEEHEDEDEADGANGNDDDDDNNDDDDDDDEDEEEDGHGHGHGENEEEVEEEEEEPEDDDEDDDEEEEEEEEELQPPKKRKK